MHFASKVINYFKKNPHILILILILLIGLFFRTYAVIERFEFAHDGDLYSWIVRDIVVNQHLRLLGQLTTAQGVFIGPLYYYMLVPFFLLTDMDPIGAIIPITIIAMLTIFSYYFVFKKLFNVQIGLIAAFLYATLLSGITIDRRVVPSTPSNLWVIWYFFTVMMIVRGNYSVLPILGVLIGLIWHIHIALAPALIAVPIAMLLSRKLPTIRQVIYFFIALFITSIPLLLFETRHNFMQTQSLINNFTAEHSGGTGANKFFSVIKMITGNVNALYFAPQIFPIFQTGIFLIANLLLGVFLVKVKLLNWKQLAVFVGWIVGMIIFFSLTSSPISEYYFYNIEVIFMTLIILTFYLLYKYSTITKFLVFAIFAVIVFKNAHYMITQEYYHKGYNERKAAVEFIYQDSKAKGYPCIGISYITAIGENVGFRYFLWRSGLHIIRPDLNIPVYNILVPEEMAEGEGKVRFEHVGVIPPKPSESTDSAYIAKRCKEENVNTTAPILYTE